ncbi:MAG: large-conductance mechanosensitive channel protein MscL [Fimbriimonadaceae bacterium]
MGMVAEFKEFISGGSVIDLAVGVIVGGASGKIVESLVKDVIMPPIGLLMGGVDFAKLAIPIKAASVGPDGKEIAAVSINYGLFINEVISFLILMFAIFMIVKAVNKMRKPKPEPAPVGPTQEELLAEIRDLLKK